MIVGEFLERWQEEYREYSVREGLNKILAYSGIKQSSHESNPRSQQVQAGTVPIQALLMALVIYFFLSLFFEKE